MAEAALGLSTYRWNNNLKSFVLLALFPLLLLLLLSALFYVFSWTAVQPDGTIGRYTFENAGLVPVLGTRSPLDFTLAAALLYWPYVIGAAAIWMVLGYLFNEMMVRAATGAQPVGRADAPRIYQLLEPLCISRGLAMPKLYIIDTDALNAYATGIDQRTYSITVTRALVEQLNDAELEAVLAHELTHILDRDVRLLLVTIVFAGAISFIAQLLWRSLRLGSLRRSRGNSGIVILLIASVIAAIGYFLALILRFAISRKREYLADAGSVALTKNPEALISALRKISTNADVPHVPSEVRQMFIENPLSGSGFLNLFATHPPIEDRIHVLERLEGVTPHPSTPAHSSGSVPDAGHIG
jgi:heat shock protein HtpX